MTERREGGETESARTREFEQGDKVLGRCVVDRCVRRDRLASFYSAHALEPDEANGSCSIWSVHAGIVHRSERASTLFFDEMQATSVITHPSIPGIIAFDPAAPGPVVIARIGPGTSLRDRLAEGELLNTREVARIVSAVADALTALHSASPPVYHRAVTPERVLSGDESVMLEECGYAHALILAGMLSERELEAFAQPGYRVPSQVSRAGGAAVDRFLLAVLAFEALTGQLPFGAVTVSELDEATRDRLPSARAARPTLPQGVDDVFARAWRQGGDRPFASVREFAEELSRVLAPVESPEVSLAAVDDGDRLFGRASQRAGADEVDRALASLDEAPADAAASPDASAARRFDVEKLLPMVSAALQVGERTSSVPPERRSGKALPPLGRALDLPPSKPTLLGAPTGSARGIAPLIARAGARPAQDVTSDGDPAPEDPTPVVGYAHLGSAAFREGRDSTPESSESRPPDLSTEAELQDRLSAVDPPNTVFGEERSVVELDESLLEPSTTNTNLQRIMDEIASFRPSDRSPLSGADVGDHLSDHLDEGVTRAVNREDLVRDELAEARAIDPLDRTQHAGTPASGSTLRAPGPALHGTISKKTPLPALPPYESVSSRGTPLSSIKPTATGTRTTRRPGSELSERPPPPSESSGPRLGTPVQALGKGSSLPTTTPAPTRLNTPVPLGGAPSRPVRRSVPPGAVTKPAAAAPPIDEPAPTAEPVAIRREGDLLARVAPGVARLTALSALVATVGLIYAARQLDAYMSDPAYVMREAARPDVTPAPYDAGTPVDDLASAVTPTPEDAGSAPAVVTPAASDAATLATEMDASVASVAADVLVASTDVVRAPEAAVSTPPAVVAATDAGTPRRATPPTPAAGAVPGDAVHARVWTQLSRRVADCVEGIDSHTSVTVMVRFDGPTGMVQRIRSRGIFAEPPIGPCLEQAVTGIRVPAFTAPAWDTSFSFPIAPPRWRPPQ
ncbi:MAG: hypothetical protein U0325_02695 [Polyangiales bacterium]